MSADVVEQAWTRTGKVWSRLTAALAGAMDAAGPPLLFGFRLWASVCLALFVAFYLELDNAYWAGTSAAIVCQPQLGASLRKGWFRLIGTLIGAVFIVALTSAFAQDRFAFLALLALWCGVCAYFATQLKNFASYAAALGGYTAVIIATDTLGATGGSDGRVFMLAIYRASEISIGIVSAGIVLAGTDLGRARRQLARSIADLASQIACAFFGVLERAGPDMPDTQDQRREFVRRAIALDPVIDQAIGESSQLRYHSPVLQTAVHGLFLAIDGWRTVALNLGQLGADEAQRQARIVRDSIGQALQSVLTSGSPARWIADPVRLGNECDAAMRALLALPAQSPSLRLLADQTASLMSGLVRVIDGLTLLVDAPAQPLSRQGRFQLSVPDYLPALHNAVRAVLALGAVMVFWVMTAWPSGAVAMIFVAITVLLLAPRGDAAPRLASAFAVGTALAVPLAAIVKFAVLPHLETFAAFSGALGLYLVPVGALVAQKRWPSVAFMCMAMGFMFIPILAPSNEMSYDTVQFYNSSMAIAGGCAVAALSFYLIPPLPPELRARRLLRFALEDLRQSAIAANPPTLTEWEQRIYGRLAALPDKASPVQRTHLISAFTVGSEVIKLRGLAPMLPLNPELHAALLALSQGDTGVAIARLGELDRRLAAFKGREADERLALRARTSILIITESIGAHGIYFDAGAKP